jgi:hypothetical protein
MSYNGRSFKKHAPQHASQAARHANAMIKQGVEPKQAVKHADKAAGRSATVHDPLREGYNKVDRMIPVALMSERRSWLQRPLLVHEATRNKTTAKCKMK